MIDEAGARLLIAMIVVQAARDAKHGDQAAIMFLVTAGHELLDTLGISLDLRAWLAELPKPAQPLLPGLEE